MAASTKDIAAELGVSPRNLRKFLRHAGVGVGQGSRYEFDSADLERIRARFAAWNAGRAKLVRFVDEDEDADSDES